MVAMRKAAYRLNALGDCDERELSLVMSTLVGCLDDRHDEVRERSLYWLVFDFEQQLREVGRKLCRLVAKNVGEVFATSAGGAVTIFVRRQVRLHPRHRLRR